MIKSPTFNHAGLVFPNRAAIVLLNTEEASNEGESGRNQQSAHDCFFKLTCFKLNMFLLWDFVSLKPRGRDEAACLPAALVSDRWVAFPWERGSTEPHSWEGDGRTDGLSAELMFSGQFLLLCRAELLGTRQSQFLCQVQLLPMNQQQK